MGTTVACATLNGVLLYGADGAPLGELSTGPRGWQHAVLALGDGALVSGGDDRLLHYWDVAAKKELRHVGGLLQRPFARSAFDGAEASGGALRTARAARGRRWHRHAR